MKGKEKNLVFLNNPTTHCFPDFINFFNTVTAYFAFIIIN